MKKSSHIFKLSPVLDDGVLRVGGRLGKSAMPEEKKHPVILAKDLHVSDLLLRHIHQAVGHGGRNYMLSELRQRYWIPGASTAIRRILSKCIVCRRLPQCVNRWQICQLTESVQMKLHSPKLVWITLDPLRSRAEDA